MSHNTNPIPQLQQTDLGSTPTIYPGVILNLAPPPLEPHLVVQPPRKPSWHIWVSGVVAVVILATAGGFMLLNNQTDPPATPLPPVTEKPPADDEEDPAVVDPGTLRGNGLYGRYFKDDQLTEATTTREDDTLNFNWGRKAPLRSQPADNFGVRWRTYVTPTFSGTYTFYVRADDGVRLWLLKENRLSEWETEQGVKEYQVEIDLEASRAYSLRLDYRDLGGNSRVQLLWSGPGTKKQVIPNEHLWQPPDTLKR